MRTILFSIVAFSIAATAVGKEEAVKSGLDLQERVTKFTALVGTLREMAASKPDAAISTAFAEAAKSKWDLSIASEMTEEQVADFFSAAVSLTGPTDDNDSVVALYNPWWDAILLMKLTVQGEAPKIQEWYFLSGETFRGENCAGEPRTTTVVPERDPLSVEIWRAVAGTRGKFCCQFPLEGKRVTWGTFAATLLSVDMTKELERIQVRSAVRMKLRLNMLRNAHDCGMAEIVKGIVRKASLFQLYRHFRAEGSRKLLEPFSQLPLSIRSEFDIYGYVPTKDATLYVYVNRKSPRLFVTVTLLPKPTAQTSMLEWYDMMQSDELLKVWNGRKGASK